MLQPPGKISADAHGIQVSIWECIGLTDAAIMPY